jgi:hypothetical protein
VTNCAAFIRPEVISRWAKNRSAATARTPIISMVGGAKPLILAVRRLARMICRATSKKRPCSRRSAT